MRPTFLYGVLTTAICLFLVGNWQAAATVELLARAETLRELVDAIGRTEGGFQGAGSLASLQQRALLPANVGAVTVDTSSSVPLEHPDESKIELCMNPSDSSCAARATLFVHWRSLLAATGGKRASTILALPFFLATFSAAACFVAWHSRVVVPLRRRAAQLESQARGRLDLELLIHDLRKPLSQAKAVAQSFQNMNDPERLRNTARVLLPELTATIKRVDGMIEDVFLGGAGPPMTLVPTELEDVLSAALRETSHLDRGRQIQIAYEPGHCHQALANRRATIRILANLCANAVDAMGGAGVLTIKTRSLFLAGKSWVEIAIHNLGPPIPAAVRDKLFQPRVTGGKEGGIGLGLTSVARLVHAQQGEIRVASTEHDGTEFVVRLLGAPGRLARHPMAWPRALGSANEHDPVHLVDQYEALRRRWNAVRRNLKGPMRIIPAWLSPALTNGLHEFFAPLALEHPFDGISEHTSELTAARADHVLDLWVVGALDEQQLALSPPWTDHLNTGSDHIAILLAPQVPATPVARMFDAVIPTPTSPYQVIVALVNALEARFGLPPPENNGLGRAHADRGPPALPQRTVVIVDDDPFVLSYWRQWINNHAVVTFPTPEALLARLEIDPGFPELVSVIITDFHFGARSKLTGVDVARQSTAFTAAPVLLATDMVPQLVPDAHLFRKILRKDEASPDVIGETLKAHGIT